jgi:hypothetical protein
VTLETLNLISEINDLWEPIYPYLAEHIRELYGRGDGNILEIGPFCGVIFALHEKKIGNSFLMATFPSETTDFFQRKVKDRKHEGVFRVTGSDPSLSGVDENSIDLAIFRGAFFFPSLGEANLLEIHRVLKPNGIGFVGGGFGKHTPGKVIQNIATRSQELNLRLGKIHITEEEIRQNIHATGLEKKAQLITDGGLWVLVKK